MKTSQGHHRRRANRKDPVKIPESPLISAVKCHQAMRATPGSEPARNLLECERGDLRLHPRIPPDRARNASPTYARPLAPLYVARA